MKEGKKPKFTLGVAEAKLGNAIQEQMGFPCACNEQTGELLRGVRAHAGHLTKVCPVSLCFTSCRQCDITTHSPCNALDFKLDSGTQTHVLLAPQRQAFCRN